MTEDGYTADFSLVSSYFLSTDMTLELSVVQRRNYPLCQVEYSSVIRANH